jgi:hypothetical protein
MYIEPKEGDIGEPARVGRVTFSKTGKTLYYRGRSFRPLRGQGIRGNYFEVETGDEYWISGCKKSGNDTYGAGVVQIDEDVREEYWLTIRRRPELETQGSFRSNGAHAS